MLLLILFLVIGVFLFHRYAYTKNKEKLLSMEQELNEKSVVANELLNAVEKEKDLAFEFKSLNFEISDMSVPYLNEIDQEKVIIFFNKYFEEYGIKVNSINFTDVALSNIVYDRTVDVNNDSSYPLKVLKNQYLENVEQIQPPIGNESGTAVAESMQVSFDYETDYYSFLDFIDALQRNEINFVIPGTSMTSSVDNILNGNIQISFYSIPKLHDHENAEWIWNDMIEYGRANPFYLDDVVLNPYWTTRYDLSMVIKPIQSDSPTVSLGMFNDNSYNSYVYADNNFVENIELQLKQEDDKYFYKYKTHLGSYPENYQFWIEFEPVNEFISMDILSNARTSEDDNSGVSLKVVNTTDKLFYINLHEDDLVRPRFTVENLDNIIIKRD